MVRINGILFLYYHPLQSDANTIKEHINSFSNHSKFKIAYINTALGFPRYLKKLQFDIILFHYSLFGLDICLNEDFYNYLSKQRNSYKICFLQDEHRYWPQRTQFINNLNVDCIYTLIEPSYHNDTYLKYTTVPTLIFNLPGYVSVEMISYAQRYYIPILCFSCEPLPI
jgi:predicted MPP superfamily phosphohydrolase